MAGHSKFKNIMHRKGAQDAKRAKMFTKVIREITVAAKQSGPDPSANPRLRTALLNARQVNLPKDRVDGAIKKASDKNDLSNFESITYSGYGPCKVPIIVECLTDNKNRSNTEVRSVFNKNGGNSEANVEFLFLRAGIIIYDSTNENAEDVSVKGQKVIIRDEDSMFECSMESGASNFINKDGEFHIITDIDKLYTLAKIFEEKFGEAKSVNIGWIKNEQMSSPTEELSEESKEKIMKFLDKLEDLDDVQKVWPLI